MTEQLVLHYDIMHHPAPADLAPRKLRGATIERVVFAEGRKPTHRTEQIHSYAVHPNGIEFLVTDQPVRRRITESLRSTPQAIAFYGEMGRLRHFYAPSRLLELHERATHYLGLPEISATAPVYRHRQAYQPDGPWEYLPPEHARDWRVRARWIIPVDPKVVSLTKLAIQCSGSVINHQPMMLRARVTIDYVPG